MVAAWRLGSVSRKEEPPLIKPHHVQGHTSSEAWTELWSRPARVRTCVGGSGQWLLGRNSGEGHGADLSEDRPHSGQLGRHQPHVALECSKHV